MEKPFGRILVPIDGSSQSRTARELAIFLSKLFNSRVTVLHVIPSGPVSLPAKRYIARENYVPVSSTGIAQFPRPLKEAEIRDYTLPEGVLQEATENYRLMGQGLLTESTQLFSQNGITVYDKLIEGDDIAQTIVSEAESGNYDLVIVGNCSDEKEMCGLELGRVAKSLSSSLKVPILIVRRKSEIGKILIAVNGSESDTKIVLKGSMIAKTAVSKMILLHVQEKSVLAIKPETTETGIQILKRTSDMIEGVPVEQKLLSGDPANIIIQTSEQADVDLIVMGRYERHKPIGAALGSVANHVLNHATVPLLLV